MKVFPFLLLIISFYTATYAQFERVTYGVKAGLSLSNIYSGDFEDPLFKPGIYGGLYITTDIDRNIDASIEAVFSQQGFKLESLQEVSIGNGTELVKTEGILRLDYILFPVIGIYKPTEKLRLKFGPQFGYLINNTITNSTAFFDGSIVEREVAGLQELTKKFNLSLIAGFSVDVYEGLYFEARYNFGVSGVLKDEGNLLSDDNFFNSVIHIGLGFDLK